MACSLHEIIAEIHDEIMDNCRTVKGILTNHELTDEQKNAWIEYLDQELMALIKRKKFLQDR